MKKTKIICTIGPSCDNEQTLSSMIDAGMNVARVNFSHGDDESHERLLKLIKKVREKKNAPIGIMLDTKGPEYRIKTFEDKKITPAHHRSYNIEPILIRNNLFNIRDQSIIILLGKFDNLIINLYILPEGANILWRSDIIHILQFHITSARHSECRNKKN